MYKNKVFYDKRNAGKNYRRNKINSRKTVEEMRNRNIETLRGFAILLLLFYHFTITLNIFTSLPFIMLDEALCQFAMIIFFTISGYGTFLHYQRRTNRGERIVWWNYGICRFKKIAPPYYTCMAFILLFTSGAVFLSRNGLKSIFIYGCFIQNLFPSVSGNINGVTWTLALFMQFYLLSYPVYKSVDKWGWKVYPLYLFASLSMNKMICSYITFKDYPDVYYVIASIRQIFTTIDVFVLGMICGKTKIPDIPLRNKNLAAFGAALAVFVLSVAGVVTYWLRTGGVWGDGLQYYLWKPLINVAVVIMILFISPCTVDYDTWYGKPIQFIAKVEYHTYLWHMVLFENLKNTSGLFNGLAQHFPLGTAIGMMALSIGVGYISLMLTNNLHFGKRQITVKS